MAVESPKPRGDCPCGAYSQTRARRSRTARKYPTLSAPLSEAARRGIEAGGQWGREPGPLAADTKSPRARAAMSLAARLRGTPTPDRATIDQWATEVGARLDLPREAITAWWRPRLKLLGIKPMGAPPKSLRCGVVRRLLPGWENGRGRVRRSKGGAPNGWDVIRDAVNAAEAADAVRRGRTPPSPIDPEDLQRWWRRHRTLCSCPPV